MISLDSAGFVSEVEEKLVPIAPIIGFAINKQLGDVGADRDNMTPEQAIQFIDNMTEALEMFLGDGGSRKSRKMMISTLRKYAPDYFEEHSLI